MSSIILEAKSLTKEYKQTLALDHINLQIKKEKFMDLLVKTEQVRLLFLRLVTGLAFPTSGTLSLWGKFWNRRIAETA
jgi:galliderm_ABC: lantibiotic protection ABC transporter, ATP-binding subunit